MTLDLGPIYRTEIDGSTKGFPTEARLPLEAIAKQNWNLLNGDIPLPAAVLRKSAVDHNVDWMRRFTQMTGVCLCPHGKTSMSPQLFDRQLGAGAWGMTAATVSHLQVYRRFGVQRIIFANQLIDSNGLRFVLSELDRDPAFDFYCLVDSVEGVEILRRGVAARGCSRPLQLLVEVGQQGGRTGTRSVAAGIAVAEAVMAASPALSLRGVEGFEGVLEGASSAVSLERINRLFEDMRSVTEGCDQRGLFDYGAGPIILSAGGSQYFDLPLILRSIAGLSRDSMVVLRSGCYITHDSSWYRNYAAAIAERMPEVKDLGPGLQPAIEIWAHIQSMPEPGLAIASMGKRDCSFDVQLPTPLKWHRSTMEAPDALVDHEGLRLYDQHCYVKLPQNSPLQIGDKIAFGIAHPCTTFDRWSVLMMVDDNYRIVDAIKTFF